MINDDKTVVLPKSWGIVENYTKFGKRLVLSHVDTDNEENIDNVLLKKSVTIDMWNGRIRYFIYGRQVDPKHIEKLPEMFINLPEMSRSDDFLLFLRSFQNINVCEGVGPTDSKVIMQSSSPNDIFIIGNNYYSIDCCLVAAVRKCEPCKKFRRSILYRKRKLSDGCTSYLNDINEEKKSKVEIMKFDAVYESVNDKNRENKPKVEIRRLDSVSKPVNDQNKEKKPEVRIRKLNTTFKSNNNSNNMKRTEVKITNSTVISRSNLIMMKYRKLLPKKN